MLTLYYHVILHLTNRTSTKYQQFCTKLHWALINSLATCSVYVPTLYRATLTVFSMRWIKHQLNFERSCTVIYHLFTNLCWFCIFIYLCFVFVLSFMYQLWNSTLLQFNNSFFVCWIDLNKCINILEHVYVVLKEHICIHNRIKKNINVYRLMNISSTMPLIGCSHKL